MRQSIRVSPRAKRPGIQGLREDGVLVVRVSAPPEDGRANAELCAVLAKALGLRKRDVRVVVGHTARDKVVELDGIGAEALAAAFLDGE
jgi:uncharacterized protein (TIGR00251 family)